MEAQTPVQEETKQPETVKTRKKYDQNFKLDVIKKIETEGCNVNDVAAEYGINANMISRWKKQLEEQDNNAVPQERLAKGQVNDDLATLSRELAEVKSDREILKKALEVLVRTTK